MAKKDYYDSEKIKSGETMTTGYGRDRSDEAPFSGQSLSDEKLVDRGISHSIKNGDVPNDNG